MKIAVSPLSLHEILTMKIVGPDDVKSPMTGNWPPKAEFLLCGKFSRNSTFLSIDLLPYGREVHAFQIRSPVTGKQAKLKLGDCYVFHIQRTNAAADHLFIEDLVGVVYDLTNRKFFT